MSAMTMMKKIKTIAATGMVAGLLLGGAFSPQTVHANPAGGFHAYHADFETLSDFLPVQGDDGAAPSDDVTDDSGMAEKKYRERHGKNMEEKRARMMERIEKMPPEEREQALKEMEEMKARKEAIRKELESLPPEERDARMKELKEEFQQKREARREEFHEKFQERWNGASEEEKAEFCGNAKQRCAEGGNHACEFAKNSCAAPE